jgi:hypothetical protein
MADPVISKSKFLWGTQCSKLLWYAYHDKAAFPAPEPELLERFNHGHGIGRLARTLFPGGIEIAPDTYDVYRVAEASRLALSSRRPLFEAGFIHRRAFARADILVPFGRSDWDIIEVKSCTEVKEVHLQDIALQRYVYEGAGLAIRRCFVMHVADHVDAKVERDPKRLFVLSDVTTRVRPLLAGVSGRMAIMHEIIRQSDCPATGTGRHCHEPYDCPLLSLCSPVRVPQGVADATPTSHGLNWTVTPGAGICHVIA